MRVAILSIAILLHSLIDGYSQNRRDPSYSVHNYKHPNKAEEAAKNDYDHLQKFEYQKIRGNAHRNYKAQNQTSSTYEAGVVPAAPIEKRTNSVFSNRNYKRQF